MSSMNRSTKRLYDEDAYLYTCEAKVCSCEEDAGGRWAIVFDQTCFFPEAGGQACDLGRIRREGERYSRVTDVQIDDFGVITHYCDASLEAGMTVVLEIDAKRRHTLMQHHTGEHIVSGLVYRHFGYHNAGFHLSDHICTMDYDGPLREEEVRALEAEANEWIYRNVPITCVCPSDEELAAIDYRCKGELTPPIRIVTIGTENETPLSHGAARNGNDTAQKPAGAGPAAHGEAVRAVGDLRDCVTPVSEGVSGLPDRGTRFPEGIVDRCACCAPHVRNTGEIGMIRVTDASPHRGGVRLTIVCGRVALRSAGEELGVLRGMEQILSVPQQRLQERLLETIEKRRALREQIVGLQKKLLAMELAALPGDARDAVLFTEGADDKTIRFTVNDLMEEHEGICGIFYGSDEEGYRFILGSGSMDMRRVAERLRKEVSAKCGGSAQMIQGSVPADKARILSVMPSS